MHNKTFEQAWAWIQLIRHKATTQELEQWEKDQEKTLIAGMNFDQYGTERYNRILMRLRTIRKELENRKVEQ